MKKTEYSLEPEVIVLDLGENSPELYSGISAQLEEYGWRILDLRITHGHILPGVRPIGILTGKSPPDLLLQRMLRMGCPAVRLGNIPDPASDPVVPAVLPDMPTVGCLAAEHFAERGFNHMAYVGNYPGHFPRWYDFFLERAKELGCTPQLFLVKPPPVSVAGEERFRSRLQQMADWLLEVPKPIGVFTYNDRNAATLFTAARLKHLACPEAVALLGVGNDSSICDLLPVPLSSVDTNEKERGRQAVILLKQILDGEKKSGERLMIPPKGIVERQSTDLMAVPDPVVAHALRFIWDHYTDQLSVDDVADISGVSRTSLCRKFGRCLGRGINAELRRKRLEASAHLLRSTQMTVATIAETTGFPSLPYLFKAFKQEYGMTPKEFRRKKGRSGGGRRES
ncbi:MAG: substrate-binding domain-containing protein [Lentisphaeria bacterium]|nr:substrate-binding domain-containing protein [Lentisphaeria bacterium]